MKEIKKDIYIAEDGKEFDYEWECERYECGNARQKLETSKNVIVINHDDINVSYLKDTKWYYVKNIEGAKEIIQAFPYIIYNNTLKDASNIKNWVNKIICIRHYNDQDFYRKAVMYELNDWITKINNWIDRYTATLEDLIKVKETYININNSKAVVNNN